MRSNFLCPSCFNRVITDFDNSSNKLKIIESDTDYPYDDIEFCISEKGLLSPKCKKCKRQKMIELDSTFILILQKLHQIEFVDIISINGASYYRSSDSGFKYILTKPYVILDIKNIDYYAEDILFRMKIAFKKDYTLRSSIGVYELVKNNNSYTPINLLAFLWGSNSGGYCKSDSIRIRIDAAYEEWDNNGIYNMYNFKNEESIRDYIVKTTEILNRFLVKIFKPL